MPIALGTSDLPAFRMSVLFESCCLVIMYAFSLLNRPGIGNTRNEEVAGQKRRKASKVAQASHDLLVYPV